jgi:hypothetical protein
MIGPRVGDVHLKTMKAGSHIWAQAYTVVLFYPLTSITVSIGQEIYLQAIKVQYHGPVSDITQCLSTYWHHKVLRCKITASGDGTTLRVPNTDIATTSVQTSMGTNPLHIQFIQYSMLLNSI